MRQHQALQFPGDPFNLRERPIPSTVNWSDGAVALDDKVKYIALYAQDHWTLKRVTAQRRAPLRSRDERLRLELFRSESVRDDRVLHSPTDGVNYKDLTPRVAVTWDVPGNGKTAVKWNMGKYHNASGISVGFYSAANPARRMVNSLQRNWTDTNDDRHVDCNLMNPANNGECGAFSFGITTRPWRTSAQDPGHASASRRSSAAAPKPGISAARAGLLQRVRRNRAERLGRAPRRMAVRPRRPARVLPRLSAEFIYHRRNYTNLDMRDGLNIGCDRFGGATDFATCNRRRC